MDTIRGLLNVTGCSEEPVETTVVIPVPGNYFLILLLLALSGLFSGLTLGLLSLDKIGLQVIIGGGDAVLAKYATAILPVRDKGNQLLCTLLFGNVAVNSLLSILMADMTSGLIGFFSSTIMIVIFGEIVPQASCSRHALLVGYYTIYITKFFMGVFFVVAYPLGMALDYALGADLGNILSKGELNTFLELHVKHGAVDHESGQMMHGALKFRDMMVQEIMTPASEVFMLSLSESLNYKVMKKIFRSGFSRIPVFDTDRNDIVGILLAKDLMLLDPKHECPLRNFLSLFGRPPVIVWPDHKLGAMLEVFRQGRGHMAVVRDVNNSGPGDPFYEFKGIVTLEDIVEEILGQEINDELDIGLEDDTSGHKDEGNRDRDLAMLALLNGKTDEDKLSIQEIQAISSHLMTNVAKFEETCKIASGGCVSDSTDLEYILTKATVVSHDRISTDSMLGHRTPDASDVLYAFHTLSDRCILILSGKAVIYSGNDQFRSELGPWSILGLDALRCADDQFSPDFDAYVLSDNIRYLILTKRDFIGSPPETPGVGRRARPKAFGARSKGFGRQVSAGSQNPRGAAKSDNPEAVISPFWSQDAPTRNPSSVRDYRGDSTSTSNGFELTSNPVNGNYSKLSNASAADTDDILFLEENQV